MIRASHVSSFLCALTLFPFVIPLLIAFAFPIAVSYAVAHVVSDMRLHEEFLSIRSFRSMHVTVYTCLLLFSCVTTTLYIPLVTHIAPHCYRSGKHYVVGTLKKQLTYLEPGLFHRILPRVTFFFEKRSASSPRLTFENVFFSLPQKNEAFSLLCADRASLDDTVLSLTKGTFVRYDRATWYKGSFEHSYYNLTALIDGAQTNPLVRSVKLSTLSELKNEKDLYYDAYLEYHKRIMHGVWFFMFPFLAYWLIVRVPFSLLSSLTSILVGGGLFLLSFGFMLCCQIGMPSCSWPLFLFYGAHAVLFLAFYLFFKKRQDVL